MAETTDTLETLKARYPQYVECTHSFRGDDTVVLRREGLKEVCRFLRDEPGQSYEMLVDLTCVDYPGREKRFEVVYHLYSLTHNKRVRLKVPVPEGEAWVETVSDLWQVADWLEREAWDMFGITFKGHPNLKRILLYEEFQGHPLRKDYPAKLEQPRIELREVKEARFTLAEQVRPMGPDGETPGEGGAAT
jgi:NADH-quinone oxidoreductase subunit C